MLALGFVSGLPLYLSGLTLSQWLTESGISTQSIGLVAYLGLPYTLKFLWGPLLDQVAPPGALARFGRRRGWLLAVQPPLALCVLVMALSDPVRTPVLTVAAAFGIALFSATQDIAIDAWRIESFPPDRQGLANALYVWGYRLAMFVAFKGVLWGVSRVGWHQALGLVAAVAAAAALVTWLAPEPPPPALHPAPQPRRHPFARMAESLTDFVRQRSAALALGYVALFNLGEAMAGTLITPFYAHLGFDRTAVGNALGLYPLLATVVGIGAGGALVARLGLRRAMVATGFGQMAAMGMYVVLALHPGQVGLLYATSVIETFAQGVATAAFLAYLSSLCSPAYAATQFALLTSLAPLAARTVGGLSGFLEAQVGWAAFYAAAMVASLPAMLLMLVILSRDQRLRQT